MSHRSPRKFLKPPWPRIWPEKGYVNFKTPGGCNIQAMITTKEREFINEACKIAGMGRGRWMRLVLCNEALQTVKSGVDRWSSENKVKYGYKGKMEAGYDKPGPPEIPWDAS